MMFCKRCGCEMEGAITNYCDLCREEIEKGYAIPSGKVENDV